MSRWWNSLPNRPRARTPLSAVLVAAALLALPAGPAASAGAGQAPSPDDVDIPIVSYDFEGASLGANWTVADVDANNGTDTWARSTYRASAGNGSAWAAGEGNRTYNGTTTFLTDGFEGAIAANWTMEDLNNLSGYDYWGPSSARARTGSYSLWSAAVGFNDDNGTDVNANLSLYDTEMEALALHNITLPPAGHAMISFWYWLDAEDGYDYLFLVLNVSGSWIIRDAQTGSSGPGQGWLRSQWLVPAGTAQFGFLFISDSIFVDEGAYVDDIELVTVEASTVINEGFEAPLAPNWTASDRDGTYGSDYWNRTTARSFSGNWSAWSAEEGYNDDTAAGDNRNISLYDSYMDAIIWRSVDLSNYTSAQLDFALWLDAEWTYDFFYVAYFSANRWTLIGQTDGSEMPFLAWIRVTASIPVTATRVGFVFQTDLSIVYEGAYVDDVLLLGFPRVEANAALRAYDDGMNATMVAPVSLGALPSARLEYSYWIDTGGPLNFLEVMYQVGGMWFAADRRSGSSGGWQSSTVALPANTTHIGFRFVSAVLGTREGAYVDDLRVIGTAPDLTCTADVSPLAGIEQDTIFSFTATPAGGILPLSVTWDFGDGTVGNGASPAHGYNTAGIYNVTLTVRDAVGQACTPPSLTVDVSHDLDPLILTPPFGQVVEGMTVQISATDDVGHALAFDWSVDDPVCGSLAPLTGPATDFTASQDAGGMTCTIQAAFGGAFGSASFDVLHDVQTITVTPGTAELVEGQSVSLSATDTHGHALPFMWSTTCGSVSPESDSATTTFTAATDGPGLCEVTASYGGGSASALVTVTHDLGNVRVEADSTTVLEGADITLRFVDGAGHVLEALWSVTPAGCGQLSQAAPGEVTLAIDAGAGGTSCDVEATYGSAVASATLTIDHDTSGAAISPPDTLVIEGGDRAFTYRDTHGHAIDVAWSLDPPSCGALSATTGSATTVRLSATAGGSVCVLSATLGAQVWTAAITVDHGPATTVTVAPTSSSAVEGEAVTFMATLRDAAGHELDASVVGWTTDCGARSTSTGSTTVVTMRSDAGGTDCTVTASHGSISDAVTVTVRHAGPFHVAVTPSTRILEAGATADFTAAVRDAAGHDVAGASIAWEVTCGSLSAATGASVTFTAAELAATCQVMASATLTGETVEAAIASVTVTAPEGPGDGGGGGGGGGGVDMLLVGGLVAAIAVGGAAFMLMRRSRGRGGEPGEGGQPPAAP